MGGSQMYHHTVPQAAGDMYHHSMLLLHTAALHGQLAISAAVLAVACGYAGLRRARSRG